MTRPEYLFCHNQTSPSYVKFIYRVVGDTEKYWKCLIDGSGDTFLVKKSDLKRQGLCTQYHTMTKAEVDEYRLWMHLIVKVRGIDFYKLSAKQLADILEVVSGGKNEKKS